MPEKKQGVIYIKYSTPILRREPYGIFKKALASVKYTEESPSSTVRPRVASKV